MTGSNTIVGLTKDQFASVVSLVITLTVANGLKLHMNNNLSMGGFSRDWQISVVALVVGNLVNMFVTTNILEAIMKKYTKYTPNSLGSILMKDIVETGMLLLTAQVVTDMLHGRDLQLSGSFFRNVFLAICGVLVYDIVIRPLIRDEMSHAKYIREVTKKTFSIAAADYMSDLDFDNFGIEAGTTAAGIVIGDLSSTPIADRMFDSSTSETPAAPPADAAAAAPAPAAAAPVPDAN